jgi:nucleotide-binding universal stress UspA family protein
MTDSSTTESNGRIIVGVDGSESSKQALRWAISLSGSLGATLDAIGTWSEPTMTGWEGVIPDWNPQADMEKVLADAVDAVVAAGRPSWINLIVCEGDPATVLIGRAQHATMLVVGSRGHGGFTGLLLGSVSTKCAEHASCPVLVVHGDTAVPGRLVETLEPKAASNAQTAAEQSSRA